MGGSHEQIYKCHFIVWKIICYTHSVSICSPVGFSNTKAHRSIISGERLRVRNKNRRSEDYPQMVPCRLMKRLHSSCRSSKTQLIPTTHTTAPRGGARASNNQFWETKRIFMPLRCRAGWYEQLVRSSGTGRSTKASFVSRQYWHAHTRLNIRYEKSDFPM